MTHYTKTFRDFQSEVDKQPFEQVRRAFELITQLEDVNNINKQKPIESKDKGWTDYYFRYLVEHSFSDSPMYSYKFSFRVSVHGERIMLVIRPNKNGIWVMCRKGPKWTDKNRTVADNEYVWNNLALGSERNPEEILSILTDLDCLPGFDLDIALTNRLGFALTGSGTLAF